MNAIKRFPIFLVLIVLLVPLFAEPVSLHFVSAQEGSPIAEPASDVDGIPDQNDLCYDTANPDQADSDGDGIGDACDPTPLGDPDTDADGILDSQDACPEDATNACTLPPDTDGDGIADDQDACPDDPTNACLVPTETPAESAPTETPAESAVTETPTEPAATDTPVDVASPEIPVQAAAGDGPSPELVSIGDFVWYDTNANGLQDPGEAGVPNVTVSLYKGDMFEDPVYIASTTTNVDGYYWFTNLEAGGVYYQLQFDAPDGYAWTLQNVGFEDENVGLKSVVDEDGWWELKTLYSGGSNSSGPNVTDDPTLDAGLVEIEAPTIIPTVTDMPTQTATATPSNTPTASPTNTPSNTPTNTATNTATSTPSNTPSNTATNTPPSTATATPSNTATSTPTDTATATSTATNTPTSTATDTPTNTATSTPSATPTPNTGEGADVAVPLPDGQISFSQINQAGQTTILPLTNPPAPVPDGFSLNGATFFDIQTTALFDGMVTICLNYDPDAFADPSSVRLLHFENGNWVDVTTSAPGANPVCGVVSSLSPFAIVQQLASTATPTSTPSATATNTPAPILVPGRFAPGSWVRTIFRLNLRSGPGTNNAVVGILRHNTRCRVTSYPMLVGWFVWYGVDCAGYAPGYVAGLFLIGTTPPSSAVSSAVTNTALSAPGGFASGDMMRTTARVNLRGGASLHNAVVAVLPSNTSCQITGAAITAGGRVWFPVSCTRFGAGFLAGSYLKR